MRQTKPLGLSCEGKSDNLSSLCDRQPANEKSSIIQRKQKAAYWNEANASFDQTPRDDTAGGEFRGFHLVHTVEAACRGGLFGQIDGFGCFGLHPKDELV